MATIAPSTPSPARGSERGASDRRRQRRTRRAGARASRDAFAVPGLPTVGTSAVARPIGHRHGPHADGRPDARSVRGSRQRQDAVVERSAGRRRQGADRAWPGGRFEPRRVGAGRPRCGRRSVARPAPRRWRRGSRRARPSATGRTGSGRRTRPRRAGRVSSADDRAAVADPAAPATPTSEAMTPVEERRAVGREQAATHGHEPRTRKEPAKSHQERGSVGPVSSGRAAGARVGSAHVGYTGWRSGAVASIPRR